MALESEYIPTQTSRLGSLSPEERRISKKQFWAFLHFEQSWLRRAENIVLSRRT